MTVLERGHNDRGWSEFAVKIERMAPLIDAPPVILTAPKKIDRFPKVLAIASHPDLAGLWVNAHAPGIAQAVRPVFRSCIFHPDKWIVLRYRVRSCGIRMIDINADNATV